MLFATTSSLQVQKGEKEKEKDALTILMPKFLGRFYAKRRFTEFLIYFRASFWHGHLADMTGAVLILQQQMPPPLDARGADCCTPRTPQA